MNVSVRNGEQNVLIVLGMHRSGTSAFARVINLLGVDLGDEFLSPMPDNPAGYWEHLHIYHGHERMLNSMGRVWHSLSPFPKNWWEDEAVLRYRTRIINTVRKDFSESSLWGFKDPRLCRLLPVWHSIFSELRSKPYFIYVFRDPFEVAASMSKRDGFSRDKCLLLWLLHTVESEIESRPYPRVFVTFDAILTDWRSTAGNIAETLNIQWPRSTVEAEEEIARFLNPDLKHHRKSQCSQDEDSRFAQSVAEINRALQEAEKGDESSIREVCSRIIDELKRECGDLPPQLLAEELKSLRLRLAETEAWVYEEEKLVNGLQSQVYNLSKHLEEVLQSRSWKLTAPLRYGFSLIERLRS